MTSIHLMFDKFFKEMYVRCVTTLVKDCSVWKYFVMMSCCVCCYVSSVFIFSRSFTKKCKKFGHFHSDQNVLINCYHAGLGQCSFVNFRVRRENPGFCFCVLHVVSFSYKIIVKHLVDYSLWCCLNFHTYS